MDTSPQAFMMNTSTRHTEWKVVIARSFPKNADYDLVSFLEIFSAYLQNSVLVEIDL